MAHVAQVKGIQFCVLSPAEIRKRSVVEVTENQAFAGNEPVPNGLFDPFMGVVDNNLVCATCRQTNLFCPGHFGHIELARPVFSIQFFDIVRKIMRCVCFRCSRLVVNLDAPDVAAVVGRKGMSRQKRWEAMSKLCQKVKRCGHDTIDGCGARMPDKVTKTDDMKLRIRMVWKESTPGAGDGRDAVFTAEDVLRVLQRVTDADCEILGFSARYNRPEWMISTALSVPPPSVRPSVRQDNGQRQEDDLTHKLSDIIKANNQIKQKIARMWAEDADRSQAADEADAADADADAAAAVDAADADAAAAAAADDDTESVISTTTTVAESQGGRRQQRQRQQQQQQGGNADDLETIDNTLVPILQYHVAMFIDNTVSSMYPSKDRTGRTLRSLSERLRHKEGRIRGNLMGKRVDFSARTVITPDPNLSIDELGVPIKIAMNLTFPEVVHPINIESMQRLVATGPTEYPGAKQIRQGDRTIMLRNHPDRASIVLQPGDIVERHLMNGDYVLFNRQPSLHKMSMMAHRVRVMNYHTFRLNVCVCASYNADFDGDEMNMHVPQSLQTHYELKQLAAVPQHILSPRYSKPIITIVQDIALGVYRISMPNIQVAHRQLLNLISSNDVLLSVAEDLLMGPKTPSQFSGRRALSTVLPPTANMTLNSGDPEAADYDPEIHKVCIRDGIIHSGMLNKSIFSRASTGLVHSTYNMLGPEAVTALLNATQKLICDWLVISGFSVGIDDLVVPPAQVEEQREILIQAKDAALETIRSVHNGAFKNSSTKSNSEYIEEQISAHLARGQKDAGKLSIANSSRDNRMLNMINSGSKGKEHNFLQMTTALGGQAIDGKRVPDGFDHRTLPHFAKFDDSPESRGFVEHSFIQGLQPHEFFFHSMAGRIGLIDTAVMSVTRETEIVIAAVGKGSRQVKIGDWIDELMERKKYSIEHFPEQANMELLNLEADEQVYIPTGDEKGKASWALLTAVTRHDPGERLYKVTTVGGRDVTVAESKSLLVWKPESETFEMMHSPDVKIGDFLPVCASLPAPPPELVVDHVLMEDFLSKEDHIYGSDFNEAIRCDSESDLDSTATNPLFDEDSCDDASDDRRLMAEAQGDKFHIPRGWWEKTNGPGGPFHLPYPKKSLLTRVLGRSNVENVKDGLVYPYHATRCHGGVPEKFLLTFENGQFIGLFLADGHTCEKSGAVGITKNEPAVREFAKAWFEKHGFSTGITTKKSDIGESVTVQGRSTLLARFLDRWVGHGSHNKKVPDAAFTAPEEFARGLLNGYFSGDGTVGDNCIESSSMSRDLTEGIAMLCARFGAFAKLSISDATTKLHSTDKPLFRLSVRAQWAFNIASTIGNLVNPSKDKLMQQLRVELAGKTSYAYEQREDMVLDAVKSIEILGVDEHPKLYDVTVPSTLNFIDRQMLLLRDTSETGYIQRRLVKAMEDCKISNDLSVRNASNQIIQFLYGDDGMDSIKLEHQFLPSIDMEVSQMYAKFYHVASSPALQERCDAHFRSLLNDRMGVICNLHDGMEMHDVPIVYPVHMQRLVSTALATEGGRTEGSEGSGGSEGTEGSKDAFVSYVLDELDRLVETLRIPTLKPRPGSSSANVLTWMPVLLRCFLSPLALAAQGLSLEGFKKVVTYVEKAFWDALASPGEMVGIVAAQSIGEISTQLTLNSVDWRTELLLSIDDSELRRVKIGDFIDAIIETADKEDLEDHENRTTLAWINRPGMPVVKVLSPDEDGKVNWQVVEAVTQHPPINQDGTSTLLKVTTATGREVIATKAKSFLMRKDNKLVASRGDELRVGDYLPVSEVLPLPAGAAVPDSMHLDRNNRIPAAMLAVPTAIAQDFVDECFKGGSIIVSTDRSLLEDISNVMLRCGGDRTAIEEGAGTYILLKLSPDCSGTDVVPGVNLDGTADALMSKTAMRDLLADGSDADKEVLQKALAQDVFYDRIVSIEEVESPYEFVYDLTVEKTRTFQTYHGLGCYDTFHSSGIASLTKVTSGIPRMKELMSVSKRIKTPTMQIYLRPEWAVSMERSMEVMSELCTTYIKDVVSRTSIYFDPYDDERTTVTEDREMLAFYDSFGSLPEDCDPEESPWVLRLEFDRMKMLELNVTMLDIELTLNSFYESSIACLVSDDNAPNLVCRLRIAALPTDSNDLLTEIKALEHYLMEGMVIKGIPGIAKAMVEKPRNLKRFDKVTESFVQDEEWSIVTSGSNLLQVMCHPCVDSTRASTNDVHEVYLALGIEAARQVLINEMMVILSGQDLNFRHLSLLADTMSNRGAFMSIDRHGINVRSDLGPLAKCSFEQTTDMLFKAGVFAELDTISGVSANTMLGQVACCGTGNSRVVMDGKALRAMGTPVQVSDAPPALGDIREESDDEMYDSDMEI